VAAAVVVDVEAKSARTRAVISAPTVQGMGIIHMSALQGIGNKKEEKVLLAEGFSMADDEPALL
jgi:hypothetical protein